LYWQYGFIIVHVLEFTKWVTWTKFQQQPVSSTFLSEQTSTSHQPNELAARGESNLGNIFTDFLFTSPFLSSYEI
jgi:hypothetical protein